MKTVIIKKGNKTTYKIVPDNWDGKEPERPTGDLTTGTIKSLNMGMTKEQYDRIFGKDKNAR